MGYNGCSACFPLAGARNQLHQNGSWYHTISTGDCLIPETAFRLLAVNRCYTSSQNHGVDNASPEQHEDHEPRGFGSTRCPKNVFPCGVKRYYTRIFHAVV